MVATTVLLDRRGTLGTFLGVGRDPVGRLRVILALLQPFLNQKTRARPMIVERAPKTEGIATGASHRRHRLFQQGFLDAAFDGVLAIRSRTPLHVLLIVDVGPGE